MHKRNLIISTCGTSLLTNGIDQYERNLLNQYSNIKDINEILDQKDKDEILSIIQRKKNEMFRKSISDVKKISAELNGIFTFYQQNIEIKDLYFFIPTDTFLGNITAEIIQTYLLDNFKIKSTLIQQTDLQTRNYRLFHSALSELAQKLGDIFDAYHTNYKIIYNLTGGFKGVNGFLQSIAQIFADEAVYLFESADEMMRIPRLPLKLDILDMMSNHLTILRKLHLGLSVNSDEVSNIPDTMLLKIDHDIALSAWGEAFWHYYKEQLYCKRILESPCLRICYTDKFVALVESWSLTSYQLFELNKKVDLLVKLILSDFKYNPHSLNWRSLKGNTMFPSTHEVNAWSDGDAKRIYCHIENDNIVLDQLGKHLI